MTWLLHLYNSCQFNITFFLFIFVSPIWLSIGPFPGTLLQAFVYIWWTFKSESSCLALWLRMVCLVFLWMRKKKTTVCSHGWVDGFVLDWHTMLQGSAIKRLMIFDVIAARLWTSANLSLQGCLTPCVQGHLLGGSFIWLILPHIKENEPQFSC